jgi:hypothetical protein
VTYFLASIVREGNQVSAAVIDLVGDRLPSFTSGSRSQQNAT